MASSSFPWFFLPFLGHLALRPEVTEGGPSFLLKKSGASFLGSTLQDPEEGYTLIKQA